MYVCLPNAMDNRAYNICNYIHKANSTANHWFTKIAMDSTTRCLRALLNLRSMTLRLH